MPGSMIYFYDKISKKNVSFTLSDELKNKIFDAAGNFFPYPIILSHDGHYTILHMDQDFKDRGTVQTKIFIDLDTYNKQKTAVQKEPIEMPPEIQKGTPIDLDNVISIIKEQVVCELKEDIMNQLQEKMKEQIQIELSAASLSTADVVIKELKEPGSAKKTRKRSSKKSTEPSQDSEQTSSSSLQPSDIDSKEKTKEESESPKTKILTLDQLSGLGLEGLDPSSKDSKKEEDK